MNKIEIDVCNTTKHDIVLQSRTVLGRLQLVQAVLPVVVRLKTGQNTEKHPSNAPGMVTANASHVASDVILPTHLQDIDLSGLTVEQRELASQLLDEQSDVFTKDDDDIGMIPNLQMNIRLHDTTPVQKNYVAVPRPLYPEVKSYIQDLLNRNFIRKSMSSYSSLVVGVRKKDNNLRLRVDYRELNRKTHVDRYPIPRVQETLDNLGGSAWFSTLDQGKAYHQGFLTSASQPLTAFIT